MAVLEQGQPFQRWEYELKPEGVHDALIRVITCGICATDHHMAHNDWGITQYPLVAGHEVVGEVVSVGSGVHDLPLGTIVGLGCIAQTCEKCHNCTHGLDHFCPETKFTYFGNVTDETGSYPHRGGFSSYVRTPASKLLRIPSSLTPTEAGPLMCAGVTTFTPLYEWTGKTCRAEGKTIGILGIGGLGHLAIQYAAKMGADDVVVFSRTADKESLARQLGATKFVVTSDEEQMKSNANGLDFLMVCISGGSFHPEVYFPLIRPYGTIHLVGIPSEKLNFGVMGLLTKRLSISASPVGSTAQCQAMLNFSSEHGVKPIIEVFPHSQINQAVAKVMDGSIRFRAVLKNDLI